MKRFLASHKVLVQILKDNVSFSLAMRNEFNNEKNKVISRHDVASLVGCSLRHHLIFAKRINDQYKDLTIEQFAYFSLALANNLFVKVEDEKKVNKEFTRLSGISDFANFVSSITNENLITEEIKKDEIAYLSYRYNTPSWLVRMWKKHYENDISLRLLKANSKPMDKFYMAKDQFDFSNGFEPSKINGIYKKQKGYTGDTKDLLVANPAYKYALDQMDIDPLRGLLIYSEVTSPIFNHLYHYLSKFSKADYIAGTPSAFFEGKHVLKDLGLSSVNIYECPSSAILTVVSKPVHTLILLPNNSRYSLLREKPEYFLNIKQEDLDTFIENEKNTLQNATPFVEEGGQLLYIIDTISRKESYGVIRDFINKNPEFSIIDQKQFLPCNSLGCSCYFALLTKKGENHD